MIAIRPCVFYSLVEQIGFTITCLPSADDVHYLSFLNSFEPRVDLRESKILWLFVIIEEGLI
jgi:hypothetical protein